MNTVLSIGVVHSTGYK